jgi:hypothetical protein
LAKLEEDEEEEVPLASRAKGKEAAVQPAPSLAQARTTSAPEAGMASTGEGIATGGAPYARGSPPTQALRKCKREVSS